MDKEVDQIAQRVMAEIQSASSKELSNASYARKVLRSSDINYVSGSASPGSAVLSGPETDIERRAVVKALLLSTWLQRLYFIIRSFLMSAIGAAITFSFVLTYGSLNLQVAMAVGAIGFVTSLLVTRLLDKQIDDATRWLVVVLSRHRSFRDFIMDHF